VQERLTHGLETGATERLRDAVAVGNAEFARRLRDVAAGRSLRGITGKAALRRRVTWQAVRAAVEEMKGEPWDHFAERRGDEGRDLFLWAARRYCALTVSELASTVGAEYTAVSVAIRRLEHRVARSRTLRDMQTRLSTMLNVAP
jgi:hypothetical protein